MTTFTTEDRVAVEQGSPEWFQMRLGKVTASRVADILAKTKTGPSASRQNYLIELAIQRTTGIIQESYSNSAMEWGVQNEGNARVLYEITTNNFVDRIAFIDHPSIKWFGCSPDGLVSDRGLVEIKCRNSAGHWETIKLNEIPKKYWIQMQAQLICTGREWNDYVSFDPRMPERSQLYIKRVFRDEEFIKEMEFEVKNFLAEVEIEVDLMRNR